MLGIAEGIACCLAIKLSMMKVKRLGWEEGWVDCWDGQWQGGMRGSVSNESGEGTFNCNQHLSTIEKL
jgi:hypothetical protein